MDAQYGISRLEVFYKINKYKKYVGKKYTIQGMYEFLGVDSVNFIDNFKLLFYAICKNYYTRINGKMELIAIPIHDEEEFKIYDLQRAVDRFIELENSQGPG